MKTFDAIVIGGGPGGTAAAIRLAKLGATTCLVESDASHLGGACTNEGCIPVKSLLESAELYSRIRESSSFGLTASVKQPDMKAIIAAASQASNRLRNGIAFNLKQSGVETVFGRASFTGEHRIQIVSPDGATDAFDASKFVIAAGSEHKPLPGLDVDESVVLSSRGALELSALPKSILIVGGGYIGCEFATIFSLLGVETTVVEIAPSILPAEDGEVSRTLAREFKKRGVKLMTSQKIKSLNLQDGKANVEIVPADGLDGGEVRNFDKVLVASGRQPALDGLSLDKAGVLVEKGFVSVDKKLLTTTKHIAACGDVIATPMLAHTASREGLVAAESLMGVRHTPLHTAVPRIVFCEPQVGSVGITEDQAVKHGLAVDIHRGFFKANGRAVVMQSDAGFVKLIADKKNGTLLGASIVGPFATELVHELCLAVENGLTISAVAKTLHGHPTLAELIGDAALGE